MVGMAAVPDADLLFRAFLNLDPVPDPTFKGMSHHFELGHKRLGWKPLRDMTK